MCEEFDVPSFEEQMSTAVKTVLSMLPNKGADRKGVMQVAHEAVLNGDMIAAKDIRILVNACPECYGVPRKKAWWRIVMKYLLPAEALQAYLIRFPTEVTVRQLSSLMEYLTKQGYKTDEIYQAFADRGFSIR